VKIFGKIDVGGNEVYSFMIITRKIPMLINKPITPPIRAEIPLVIHPQSCIGGVPNTGKHHENQRKRIKTMIPNKITNENEMRVLPPAK
jgi:hypothetical protein